MCFSDLSSVPLLRSFMLHNVDSYSLSTFCFAEVDHKQENDRLPELQYIKYKKKRTLEIIHERRDLCQIWCERDLLSTYEL